MSENNFAPFTLKYNGKPSEILIQISISEPLFEENILITDNRLKTVISLWDTGLIIPNVTVAECEDQPHFGVIIGMDIITMGDFSITNHKGNTYMSFRIPSIKHIDYENEHKIITEKNRVMQGNGFRKPPKKR